MINKWLVSFLMGILAFSQMGVASPRDELRSMIKNKEQSVVDQHLDQWTIFNEHYALIVFFSSTCPHCQRFTPIVADFTSTHKIKVYPYTIDGNGVSTFPNPLLATDEVKTKFYQSMQVVVPAVFIVNTETMEIIPIDVGEESATEFERDMNNFVQSLKR